MSDAAYSDGGDALYDDGRTIMAKIPIQLPPSDRKASKKTPQASIDEFWEKFTTKQPGKATTIIPKNEYLTRASRRKQQRQKASGGTEGTQTYEQAAANCRAKVAQIVKECRRVNQKYRDPHFDLEEDLKWGHRDTLQSLSNAAGRRGRREQEESSDFHPKAVKRVVDIFDAPKFFIEGPTANDVRQGRDGDCWFMAALCTLSNKQSLIERVCVSRDEAVGVYGFVFHRDGSWISEIIDDKLFLTKPDFDESFLERMLWEDRERVNSEESYRKAYQSGSGALYFAQCENADETWLPLLEKAYAKAHGDYAAIEGGYTGEGIEDLTGGVTSELYTTDILDREYFWKEELMKVNDQFLFGCSTGMWGIGYGDRKGIVELHAYSIMRAVEIDGQRLLLLKNPWGKFEWKGPWSDGSKEWTAEWLTKLDHRFGDDGAFWISYDDLLRKYQAFDRTRLFDADSNWRLAQIWTTLSVVPWTIDYHPTSFRFTVSKPLSSIVLVLSQLDDRYYRGLEGQYEFKLNFRLHRQGQRDYLVRTISPYRQTRSVNVELSDLEPGNYTVLVKIRAERDTSVLPPERVVRRYAVDRRDKLVTVGLSYDLAHGKGRVIETPEEARARKLAAKREEEKERKEVKENMMWNKKWNNYFDIKDQQTKREKRKKLKAKAKAKKEAWKEKQRAKGKLKSQREKEADNSDSEAPSPPEEQEEKDQQEKGGNGDPDAPTSPEKKEDEGKEGQDTTPTAPGEGNKVEEKGTTPQTEDTEVSPTITEDSTAPKEEKVADEATEESKAPSSLEESNNKAADPQIDTATPPSSSSPTPTSVKEEEQPAEKQTETQKEEKQAEEKGSESNSGEGQDGENDKKEKPEGDADEAIAKPPPHPMPTRFPPGGARPGQAPPHRGPPLPGMIPYPPMGPFGPGGPPPLRNCPRCDDGVDEYDEEDDDDDDDDDNDSLTISSTSDISERDIDFVMERRKRSQRQQQQQQDATAVRLEARRDASPTPRGGGGGNRGGNFSRVTAAPDGLKGRIKGVDADDGENKQDDKKRRGGERTGKKGDNRASDTETSTGSDSDSEGSDSDVSRGGGRRRTVFDSDSSDDENDEGFEKDPWNAVVTVGLRVYYRVKQQDGQEGKVEEARVGDENDDDKGEEEKGGKEKKKEAKEEEEEVVKLRVHRPIPRELRDNEGKKKKKKMDSDGKQDDGENIAEKGLDVDDASKDATLGGGGAVGTGDDEEKEYVIRSKE